MSMMRCSYCSDLTDTDDGEGHWDVKHISKPKVYDLVCGILAEQYITEDEELDPNLNEMRWDKQQERLMEDAP